MLPSFRSRWLFQKPGKTQRTQEAWSPLINLTLLGGWSCRMCLPLKCCLGSSEYEPRRSSPEPVHSSVVQHPSLPDFPSTGPTTSTVSCGMISFRISLPLEMMPFLTLRLGREMQETGREKPRARMGLCPSTSSGNQEDPHSTTILTQEAYSSTLLGTMACQWSAPHLGILTCPSSY